MYNICRNCATNIVVGHYVPTKLLQTSTERVANTQCCYIQNYAHTSHTRQPKKNFAHSTEEATKTKKCKHVLFRQQAPHPHHRRKPSYV